MAKFTLQNGIYTPADINKMVNDITPSDMVGNNKKIHYYNLAASFDIETSSFYRDTVTGETYDYNQMKHATHGGKMEKLATMYVWQLGINGRVMIGRTWAEFVEVCGYIVDALHLDKNHRLIIYVHNLAYEFQFIRKLFTWHKVFSIDLRKPIYAITTDFIEFRCSYLLSGYSLAKLGDQLHKYKVQKMTGDLDYSKIRHTRTPLTAPEIMYCINDVRVVMAYITEKIEEADGLITNLPLTKTGYVRQYCRNKCMYTRNDKGRRVTNYIYTGMMKEMQIQSLSEFYMLQRAFAGGFTHANAYYSDQTVTNVSSYDFTSSYPAVMVAERFPMSRGVPVAITNAKQFTTCIEKYCCIFDIEFIDLIATRPQDNPISVSKCFVKENITENNGRIVSARRVVMTITNVDYKIIEQFYTWGAARVGNMIVYKKDYLPTPFVRSILDLYQKKTTLKGVRGKETEYLQSKEMLNSCYGMTVTNPLRDEIEYTDGDQWREVAAGDMRGEQLFKYNQSKNRFLFYPWGVFVTAYARRNLFTAIAAAGSDYVYSDTDSVKLTNADAHRNYFDTYNRELIEKLKKACAYHAIDFAMCHPCTIKGTEKMLGVWDYEGTYTRFKTLGAKRYMLEESDALRVGGKSYSVSLTVSGVNKHHAIPWLIDQYGGEIFDKFTNYLHLPPEATGKNIHTYIDYPTSGEVTDYTGDTAVFSELSAVHLEPTDYHLSLSIMYLKYIQGIKFKS